LGSPEKILSHGSFRSALEAFPAKAATVSRFEMRRNKTQVHVLI
jgi:hypothetical protein